MSVVAAGLVSGESVAQADGLASGPGVAVSLPPGGSSAAPMVAPASVARQASLPASACSPIAGDGKQTCVELGAPGETASAKTGAAPRTLSEFIPPSWCGDHLDGQWWAQRFQACRNVIVTFNTYITEDGVKTQTGSVSGTVMEFILGDPSSLALVSQITYESQDGWGDGLFANISGAPSAVGGCSLNSGDTFGAPVAPIPRSISGEAFLTSTASTLGDVENCAATWTLAFDDAGYPNSEVIRSQDEFRCDNTFVGRNAGCVIPWSAADTDFFSSATPAIVSHVSQAQTSGLPGAPGTTPLHRSTDVLANTQAYNRACYQSPVVLGKSCDEYPFKTAQEGLAGDDDWQDHRRTFDNCSFILPRQTGPVGASACMVPISEQNSQGGTVSTFYQN